MRLESKQHFLLLLLVLVFPNQTALADCECKPPDNGEATHWTGNQVELFIFIERGTYRELKGKVLIPTSGAPFDGALVEVFDNPDYLLPNYSLRRGKQVRVAACRTRSDGKFCFSDLASGRYELRLSSDQRSVKWNASQIYVVVDREKGDRKDLIVTMIPRS
jgi:hypothetical protein